MPPAPPRLMPAASRWRFGQRRDSATLFLLQENRRFRGELGAAPALLRASPVPGHLCSRFVVLLRGLHRPQDRKTLPPDSEPRSGAAGRPSGGHASGDGESAGVWPERFPGGRGTPVTPSSPSPTAARSAGPWALGPDRRGRSRRRLPPRTGALAGAWGPRAEGGPGARWGRGSPGRPPEAQALRKRGGTAAALPLPWPCSRFCPYPSESLGRE